MAPLPLQASVGLAIVPDHCATQPRGRTQADARVRIASRMPQWIEDRMRRIGRGSTAVARTRGGRRQSVAVTAAADEVRMDGIEIHGEWGRAGCVVRDTQGAHMCQRLAPHAACANDAPARFRGQPRGRGTPAFHGDDLRCRSTGLQQGIRNRLQGTTRGGLRRCNAQGSCSISRRSCSPPVPSSSVRRRRGSALAGAR